MGATHRERLGCHEGPLPTPFSWSEVPPVGTELLGFKGSSSLLECKYPVKSNIIAGGTAPVTVVNNSNGDTDISGERVSARSCDRHLLCIASSNVGQSWEVNEDTGAQSS